MTYLPQFGGPGRLPPVLRALKGGAHGSFEGYASLFGVTDQGGDVVMPGAFRATLARSSPAQVRLLFQHDPSQPVGLWEEIREDGYGLFVRGRLIDEVERARELLALIRAGALDGLSIGFRARKAVRDPRSGLRRLYEIDLWEISIVTFPMLPGARLSAVKAACSPARPTPALAASPPGSERPPLGHPRSSPFRAATACAARPGRAGAFL